MKLLPSSSSLKDQAIVSLLSKQLIEKYNCFVVDTMTCDSSILEHIAIEYGVDISEMTKKELRAYLSHIKNIWSKKGTVKAVEDITKIYFDIPKIIEWWEDQSLLKGEFNVKFKIEDGCRRYSFFELERIRQFIHNVKNVRSKLKEISLEYISENSSSIFIGFMGENSMKLQMKNKYSEEINSQNIVNIGLACESFLHIQMGDYQ